MAAKLISAIVACRLPHNDIVMTYNPATTAHSCNQCEHYGGWIPTIIGAKRTWVYGWCLRARQLSTQPLQGCAHCVQVAPARTAPIVWTRDPPGAQA